MRRLAVDPGFAHTEGKADGCACVLGEGPGRTALITGAWFERPQTFMPGRPGEAFTIRSAYHGEWDENRRRAAAGDGIDEVIVEKPQYDARSDKARIQDTIELTWSGAALAFAFAGRDGCPVIGYTPTQWKGTERKPLMHRRMWAVLTPEEQEILGGELTRILIEEACLKGGLDRWANPGHTYYSQAKRARFGGGRGGFVHNLLDAGALLKIHTGQLARIG